MTGQLVDLSFVKYFMAKSVGILNPKTPIMVKPETKIAEVVDILRTKNIGCVMIVDDLGRLIGIFTERDALKKKFLQVTPDLAIEEVMTKAPQAEEPTTSIAHIMMLMSQGGYRHIPIVDDKQRPIGLVSVRDILDHLSSCLSDYYEDITQLAQMILVERETKPVILDRVS